MQISLKVVYRLYILHYTDAVCTAAVQGNNDNDEPSTGVILGVSGICGSTSLLE